MELQTFKAQEADSNCYCGLCKHWKNSQFLIGYCSVLKYNKGCSDEICDRFDLEK